MNSNAIVFGGGGGKGAYEIGVWKALREIGVSDSFNIAIGTSVGALNAALFAQQDFLTAIRIWTNISNEKIMTPLINYNGESIFSQSGLSAIIKANLSCISLKKSRISCYVCACCTDTIENKISEMNGAFKMHQMTLFNSLFSKIIAFLRETGSHGTYFRLNSMSDQDIYQALLASSALPVAFGKIQINGHYYRDGGLIPENNVPYRKAIDLGCKNILVISLEKGINRQEKIGNSNILFIHPSKDLGNLFSGTIDFSRTNAMKRVDLGYYDTLNYKTELQKLFSINGGKLFITQEEINQLLW